MDHHRRAAVILAASLFLPPSAALGAQNATGPQDPVTVLRSEAGTFDKAIACQQLAATGRADAVPALAALLGDPVLSAYARSALEAITDSSADEALLEAIGRLEGQLLVGAVNSIGVRRYAGAVEALDDLVRIGDMDVACAALAALGRIATVRAAHTLVETLREGPAGLRAPAADACLVCADRQLANGRSYRAAALYDGVREARVPRHIRLAATCRAIVTRGSAGVPMLIDLLGIGDSEAVRMALRAVREMPGEAVSRALADELAVAKPGMRALLLQALAERDDAVARAAVDDATLTFAPLSNGRTFGGWEGDIGSSFRIDDGAIVGGSLRSPIPRNEFLCTTRRYGDFVLRLECKVIGANGGVQFRSERVPGSAEVCGYQADMDASGVYWGCLYDESRRGMLVQADATEVARVLKRGDWNAYEIRCEGPRIRLFLNGLKTVDYTEADPGIPRSGLIAVQIHSGPPSETWYRNIVIAELP